MAEKSKPAITFGEIEEAGSFFNPVETDVSFKKFERIEDSQSEEEEVKEVPKSEKKQPEPTLILAGDEEAEAEVEAEVEVEAEEKVSDRETEQVIEAALEDDDTDYKELTLQLIKTGQWERFSPEEGVEIEDLEDLSKEDFELIAKTQSDWKKSEAKEKVLQDFSEEEKDFIEFKKNGGNLNLFVQNYIYKQQAQNLDIETDQGKKNAVYAYYKSMVGWDDDRIIKHINRLEKELELDEEAKSAKNELEKVSNAQYEQMIQAQEQAKAEQAERIKEYKSNVRSDLKKKEYDKKRSDAVLRAMTDIDETGYAPIDRAFLDYRNDPEKAELLYNVLLNYDEWSKIFVQDKLNEDRLNTFKTIKLNKKASDSQEYESRGKKESKLVIELPKKKR